MGGQATPTAAPAAAGPAAAGPAAAPELLSPADVAKALGVGETDVLALLDAGELKGKRIGTAWRVTRSALNEYLAS